MSNARYSRSFKASVLDAAGVSSAAQDWPYCTCGYCEDDRKDKEERFQAIMAAALAQDTGDAAAEEAAYQALRATGRDLDAWSKRSNLNRT